MAERPFDHGGEGHARARVEGGIPKGAAPDFSINTGDGEILHGELARIAHNQWADIPYELARRWTAAARRRRPQAVHNLTVAAQEKAPDAAIEGQERSMGLQPKLSATAKSLK